MLRGEAVRALNCLLCILLPGFLGKCDCVEADKCLVFYLYYMLSMCARAHHSFAPALSSSARRRR